MIEEAQQIVLALRSLSEPATELKATDRQREALIYSEVLL